MTHQQHVLLEFLRRRHAEGGATPSMSEMARALGVKSKSSVVRVLRGLEERGRIRRLPHRARAVEILEPPRDDAAALIATVLEHPAVELVEHAHPGWRAKARALLDLKAAALSIALLVAFAAPAFGLDAMPGEVRARCLFAPPEGS